MSAGDILDAAIRLYRQNFIPLVTIVAIVNVPILVLQSVGYAFVLPLSDDPNAFRNLNPSTVGIFFGILTFVVALVGGIFSLLELGALTAFVSERFLGHEMTVRRAYRVAFGRAVSLLIAAILFFFAVLALVAVVMGIIFVPVLALGVSGGTNQTGNALAGIAFLCLCVLFIPLLLGVAYFTTRWIFWIQAIVIEQYNSTGGLGRSWKLVKGSFWRVFGFLLLISLMVYFLTLGPVGAMSVGLVFLPSPLLRFVLQSILSGIIGILVAPLQYTTLTVLYYDLRIRKEGFDLQMQMQDTPPGSSGLEPPLDLPSLIPGSS